MLFRSEVGAIATQAECNLEYGAKGLEWLRLGIKADDVVKKLVEEDENREVRQIAVIDAKGNVGVFTGKGCVRFAGDYGEENFGVVGNMLATDKVISRMVEFYKSSDLPLEQRVLETLRVAQNEGGDVRGRRSGGLLSVEGKVSGEYWRGVVYDLRVDDHVQPVEELKRLYRVAMAYQSMNRGDVEYYENNRVEMAMNEYKKAAELMPENPETKFWYAKLLWDAGKKSEAKGVLGEVFEAGEQWREYWRRVVGELM